MVPTVLLVDDDDCLRHNLVDAFQEAGYRVAQAADGQAAMVHLKREGDAIHVVVTDIRIPMFSGYQLADWMAVWDYQQPIVFISGSGQADVNLPGPLLNKPFSAGTLIAAVRRALRQIGISPPDTPIATKRRLVGG